MALGSLEKLLVGLFSLGASTSSAVAADGSCKIGADCKDTTTNHASVLSSPVDISGLFQTKTARALTTRVPMTGDPNVASEPHRVQLMELEEVPVLETYSREVTANETILLDLDDVKDGCCKAMTGECFSCWNDLFKCEKDPKRKRCQVLFEVVKEYLGEFCKEPKIEGLSVCKTSCAKLDCGNVCSPVCIGSVCPAVMGNCDVSGQCVISHGDLGCDVEVPFCRNSGPQTCKKLCLPAPSCESGQCAMRKGTCCDYECEEDKCKGVGCDEPEKCKDGMYLGQPPGECCPGCVYNCFSKEVWAKEKSDWCCDNKGLCREDDVVTPSSE